MAEGKSWKPRTLSQILRSDNRLFDSTAGSKNWRTPIVKSKTVKEKEREIREAESEKIRKDPYYPCTNPSFDLTFMFSDKKEKEIKRELVDSYLCARDSVLALCSIDNRSVTTHKTSGSNFMVDDEDISVEMSDSLAVVYRYSGSNEHLLGLNGKEWVFNVKSSDKIVHDLVCEVITGKGELTINLKDLNVDWHIVPDGLVERNHVLELFELKTTLSDYEHDVIYDSIQGTYSMSSPWFLIASPSKITTNLSLDANQVDGISRAVVLGQKMRSLATSKGYCKPLSDETVSTHKSILESMRMTPLGKVEGHLEFGVDYMDGLVPYTDSELRKKVKMMVKSSSTNCSVNGTEWLIERMKEDDDNPDMVKQNVPHVIKTPFFHVVKNPEKLNVRLSIDNPEKLDGTKGVKEVWKSILMMKKDWTSYEVKKWDIDSEEKIGTPSMVKHLSNCKEMLELSRDSKVELMKMGFQGKSMIDSSSKDIHDKNSKRFVKYGVDPIGIDRFINDEELLNEYGIDGLLPPSFQLLHDKARKLSMEDLEGNYKRLDDYTKTPIGSHNYLMGLIYQEINLSLQSNVKGNEVIVKKILGYPLLICLKPTNSYAHISCSIMVDNRQGWARERIYPGVFKQFKKMGNDIWVSDFFSCTRSTLSQHLQSFEVTCGIFESLNDIYNGNLKEDQMSTGLYTWLVYKDAKNGTSTALQQSRYAYMELNASPQMYRGCLKILSKLSARPRSTLESYTIGKMISNFTIMEKLRSEEESVKEDDLAADKAQENFPWLHNFITGRKIENFTIALNLCYICQFKDKNGMKKIHAQRKILKKIISSEVSLRKLDESKLGKEEDPDKCINHQFDERMVNSAGRLLRRFLCATNKIEDSNYDEFMRHCLLTALSSVRLEQLATYKASSVHKDVNKPVDMSEVKMKHETKAEEGTRTVKAMEAVLTLIDKLGMSSSVYASLHIVKAEFNLLGDGVLASLFRKAQIGSDREIFILDMLSRIMIKFVETISETICKMVPWEMLTKGSEKVEIMKKHRRKEARTLATNEDGVICRSYDSNDASKWAQGFVMKMFASVLAPLLPPEFKPVVCEVLNCVTRKKLRIPDGLLDEFRSSPVDRISKKPIEYATYIDKELVELQTQFKSELYEHHDLVNYGGRYMTNRSNMMQGILHYTSSLYHSAKMSLDLFLMRKLIKDVLPNTPDSAIVLTGSVSSDDSSLAKAVVCKKEDVPRAKAALSLCSMLVEGSCKLFGITLSLEKSTRDVRSGIIEFNSMWTVRNTIMSPRFKYVYPSLCPATIRGIENKLNTMANLRSQLSENGFKTRTIDFFQILQSHVFYRTFGLGVNPYFSDIAINMARCGTSAIGLFLYEPAPVCGLFGLDFAQYAACKSDTDYAIREMVTTEVSTDVSETGRPTISWSLTVGDDKRYKKFVERIKISKEETRSNLSSLSSILKRSRTKGDSMYKIGTKALSPSSAESFAFNDPSKAHSTAAYAITHPVIMMRDIESSIRSEKVSLTTCLLLLSNRAREREAEIRKQHDDRGKVVDWEMTIGEYCEQAFPAHEMYGTILSELRRLVIHHRSSIPSSKRSFAMRQVKCSLGRSNFNSFGSLSTSLLTLWFDEPLMTLTEARYILNSYSRLIPWLNVDMQLTFEKSPFEDEYSMLEHLSKIGPKYRTISLLLPGGRSHDLRGIIRTVMRLSAIPGQIVTYEARYGDEIVADMAFLDTKDEHSKLNLRLVAASNCPVSVAAKERMMLWAYDDYKGPKGTAKTSGIEAIVKVIREENWERSVSTVMTSVNNRAFMMYDKIQPYSDRKWTGAGEVVAVFNEFVVKLFLRDSDIVSVMCNREDGLLANKRLLNQALRSLTLGDTMRDDRVCEGLIPTRLGFHTNNGRAEITDGICGGLPIFINSSLRPCQNKLSDCNIRLKFDNRSVRLMMTLPGVGEQTMIRHNFSTNFATTDDFLNTEEIEELSEDQCAINVKDWCCNKPVSQVEVVKKCIGFGVIDRGISSMFARVKKRGVLSAKSKQMTKDWMKSTFRARMVYRGFIRSKLSQDLIDDLPQENDDIDVDRMMITNVKGTDTPMFDFEAMMFGLSQLSDGSDSSEMCDVIELEGYKEDDATDLQGMMDAFKMSTDKSLREMSFIDKSAVALYAQTSTYWDDVINVLISRKCISYFVDRKRYKGDIALMLLVEQLRSDEDIDDEDFDHDEYDEYE